MLTTMVTLNTLNTLIDDVLLTIRNSNIAASESINRLQIEQWIHYYRAQLIKEDIERNKEIDQSYIQYLNNVELENTNINGLSESVISNCTSVTKMDIPKLINTNRSNGVLSVTDVFGNQIQITSNIRAARQKYRKYTCNDYLAIYRNNKITVSGPNELQYINLALIPEDPSKLGECDFSNQPYPIPSSKIAVLKQLIFRNELGIMVGNPSDKINNSNNDLENLNVTNE